MTDGPLAAYRALCRAQTITGDPAQELAAEKLQSLHKALNGYQPASGGWASRPRKLAAKTPIACASAV